MSILKDILSELRKEAKATDYEADEDFIINDYAGGNMDDAFQYGVEQGRGDLARELLQMIEDSL